MSDQPRGAPTIGIFAALGGIGSGGPRCSRNRRRAAGDLRRSAIATLDYLFTGGTISCENSTDSNDDGSLNVADGIALLGYLFSGTAR